MATWDLALLHCRVAARDLRWGANPSIRKGFVGLTPCEMEGRLRIPS